MLEIRNLHKRYGQTVALNGLVLAVPANGVFGIAGPNGAGKSTLIRILAGEETEDGGEITLDGSPWDTSERQWAVAVVHQEPQLFPNLTVVQNLHFGLALTGMRLPAVSRREREILDELDLAPFADRELASCPLVIWQLTEIGRALLREARLFLFDEPNSALDQEESARLFAQLRRLTDNPNHIVAMVSHRLADLTEHCSEVAVIREGVCTELLTGRDVTEHAIAHALVVGIDRNATPAGVRPMLSEADESTDQIGRLRGWSSRSGAFSDIDLDLRPGQILAVLGVEGSGGRELVRSLAGLERASGSIELPGGGPRSGGQSVAYMPASRRHSLFFNFSIKANMGSRLGRPDIANRAGLLSLTRLRALSEDLRRRFQVLTPSVDQAPSSLSGGNQQKIALAATMATRPKLLAMEEPTRGVDIGTKAEIYGALRAFAREGHTVVLFCTEVGEVYDAADVAYVMTAGRLSQAIAVRTMSSLEELAASVATVSREMRQAVDKQDETRSAAKLEPA
jgi:ABC-type sugar transport system ATPase subunit